MVGKSGGKIFRKVVLFLGKKKVQNTAPNCKIWRGFHARRVSTVFWMFSTVGSILSGNSPPSNATLQPYNMPWMQYAFSLLVRVLSFLTKDTDMFNPVTTVFMCLMEIIQPSLYSGGTGLLTQSLVVLVKQLQLLFQRPEFLCHRSWFCHSLYRLLSPGWF